MRIITVGYKNGEQITELLDSLIEHLEVPAEVVLWDNGACREVVNAWRSRHRDLPFDLIVAGQGTNLGFARAVNEAVKLSSARPWKDLLIINPDAQLASPLTEEALKELSSLEGLVGLRVFDDKGKQSRQASARFFPSMMTSVAGREGLLTRLWPSNPWSQRYLGHKLDDQKVSRVDWVSGCALYAPRKIWERLGGFDEDYFLYVEDVDLGRKAQALGIPVFYSPQVDVIHAIRGSARKNPWRSDYYHHAGMWRYYRKWSKPLSRLLAPAVLAGICARFALRRLRSSE